MALKGVFSSYNNRRTGVHQNALPNANGTPWVPQQSFNRATGQRVSPTERGTFFPKGTRQDSTTVLDNTGHAASILSGRGGK